MPLVLPDAWFAEDADEEGEEGSDIVDDDTDAHEAPDADKDDAADDVWDEETFGEKRDRRRSGQWGDASSALTEAAEDQFGLV